MAERRMFAKATVGSARFLRMPATSRLLYYDLGMAADDDGVVEAFSVMRTTGATDDDLRVLASKGFVTILNDDLVTDTAPVSTMSCFAGLGSRTVDRWYTIGQPTVYPG